MTYPVEVLLTPERIMAVLRLGLDVYQHRDQRAAMRGGMADAAALCDALASEVVAQNSKRGRPSKATRDLAAAFKRCGDEIMRMRERVTMP